MRLTSLYLEAINYASHKPQLDSLSKQLNKTPQEIISWVEPITDATRYVEWILRQLKIHTIRLPEDANRIKQLLIDFDHYKSIGAADINRDIGSYKTIHDLEAIIDKLKGVDLKGRAETRQEYRAGAQWVNESPNYKLLKITTPEAAAHYGLNTKWCTSNPKIAKKYLIEGSLYIVFKKQPDGKLKKLYQYTYDYSQFRDILDKSVKPNKEIQQLIKPPLNSKPAMLAEFCAFIGSRWPEAEPIIAKDPKLAYYYVINILEHPWPEAEPTIAKNPELACYYVRDILQHPWPEAEPYIAKDPEWACHYARYVLKRPWPEAEPYIVKDPEWAYGYAADVLKRPWPEAEPIIAQNPRWAHFYARDVLKRPWPEAEPTIVKNAIWAYYYAKDVLGRPWPEAEPRIIKDPYLIYCYARDVLKRRWPEAEPYIAKDPFWACHYAKSILKGRFHEAEPFIAQYPGYWASYKRYFNIEG